MIDSKAKVLWDSHDSLKINSEIITRQQKDTWINRIKVVEDLQKVFLAIDVYGTLVNHLGVKLWFEMRGIPEVAELMASWRDKQLEYTFRRALMNDYSDFLSCTRDALVFVCQRREITLTHEQLDEVISCYRTLPAFSDAIPALKQLRQIGFPCWAFSNGRGDDVLAQMKHAGLAPLLSGVVSLFDIRTYKPDPKAYAYFRERVGSGQHDVWLISANPFDLIGAKAAGMRTMWLRRNTSIIFDTWGGKPDVEIYSLTQVAEALVRCQETRHLKE